MNLTWHNTSWVCYYNQFRKQVPIKKEFKKLWQSKIAIAQIYFKGVERNVGDNVGSLKLIKLPPPKKLK